MFLFRLLKKLLFLVFFGLLVFWAATYQIGGVPLYQRAKQFFTSEGFKQGVKDIRLFLGGFLKSLGEEIEENVTEEDQKALDSMIQKKIKEGSSNGEKK